MFHIPKTTTTLPQKPSCEADDDFQIIRNVEQTTATTTTAATTTSQEYWQQHNNNSNLITTTSMSSNSITITTATTSEDPLKDAKNISQLKSTFWIR